MDKFIVEGGVALKGRVKISGSKNAALPIIAATILTDKECILKNIPHLNDTNVMNKLINSLGGKVVFESNTVRTNNKLIKKFKAPYDLVKTMRASVYVMGALLGRYHKAEVAMPGGCIIGERPINLHLMGFEKLGAKIKIEHGYIKATAKKLKGADIYLDTVSVGATANLLMASVLAEGETILRNAAQEPHILDLCNFLNKIGAKITGEGSNTITVQGVNSLKGGTYQVISDYIEAGTFMVAAAITNGKITLENAPTGNLEAVKMKLLETGTELKETGKNITIRGIKTPKPSNIDTAPYPGFPTDMQAQWMSLMAVSSGTGIINETIWEKRFMHVPELNRMGASISTKGNTAIVKGVKELSGAPVMVSDLRAGASLVLAGLRAKGTTEISRIYHLDRGYEKIEKKLEALGARIKRIK
ncbi:MAG: UDP-N-acetylglucosamine 1-carboxyvinyltransferase [Candidatus Firestonebacteria bacterium RIFOXYC2_FULL_39_67]|nr:MAG: UDP-N-acetylglucosamine 1-carboxyvinyltransferase [Candidatus Firestonebacteria bacterium RIFOXYD2_FULL_39_29]OGF56937.1 MAG: UDP-N-acetylglucosamine 1-carboxyvinyltransferase [Candidatus Firestonebacteria bacterium RIFOXYC2_FULL_39_67]